MSEETGSNSESESGYSPLLAKMLNVNPETVGNISLSGLGRQIVGSESEAYKKKLDEVTQAQNAMIASLEARKNRIDPGALALAAGFFSPTKTGTFGENLGLALGNLSKTQEQESANAANAAKMRYELAKSGLADEETMAKLGLSAIKSLTPKLTKLQQQVMAEGLDPSTVAGRKRLVELQFLETATPELREYFYATNQMPGGMPAHVQPGVAPEPAKPGVEGIPPPPPPPPASTLSGFAAQQQQKRLEASATPEMKIYAAISGMPLGDPGFAQGFKTYMENKEARSDQTSEMKEVAAATGTKPGTQEFNRNFAIYRQYKDIMPLAAELGLNIFKPEDLTKLQKEAQRRSSLKQAVEAQSLATSRLQAQKLGQEIAENTRNGDIASSAVLAQRAGVPYDPASVPTGMTPKETAAMRTKDREASDAWITKNITPFVNTIDTDISDLERAKALNAKLPGVGSMTFGIPGIGTVAKATTGAKGKYEEFDALASKAAAQNKIPGNTSVSNADLQFMERGVFASNKERSSNETIINFMLEQRKRDKDYYKFMSNYAAVNGKLGPKANQAWREYVDNNPITVRDNNDAITLNPSRKSPEEYFSMPRVQYDAQGRQIQ